MSEKYRVECSRCHCMILSVWEKMPTEVEIRCFTCKGCEEEIKGERRTK